jgi:segregation and condensation protein A
MTEQNYKVQLPVFEGPLDLLLYLIKKEEVDIYDIPIERITTQYMEYLSVMRLLNLDIAGEFIVMAATLMYIKSRMLLPADQQVKDSEEDEGVDPRWELIRQLVEYKKFKSAAEQLQKLAAEQENLFMRQGGEVELETTAEEVPLGDVSLFDLLNAFKETLKRVEEREDFREISDERFTVTDKIGEIIFLLKERDSVLFHELFSKAASRAEIVVTFLALLELIRLKQIRVRQGDHFGEIEILKAVAS